MNKISVGDLRIVEEARENTDCTFQQCRYNRIKVCVRSTMVDILRPRRRTRYLYAYVPRESCRGHCDIDGDLGVGRCTRTRSTFIASMSYMMVKYFYVEKLWGVMQGILSTGYGWVGGWGAMYDVFGSV